MTRLVAVLVLLLALAEPAAAGMWLVGAKTNPPADWVVATTPALAGPSSSLSVYLRSTVAVSLAVERLNAGGQAITKDSVTFTLDPGPMIRLDLTVDFDAGDTFRVRVVSGVTGSVQAALRFNSAYCLQGLGCSR